MNRSNYPPNWDEISRQEREAAGNKCRRCGVPNHSLVQRNVRDKEEWIAYIIEHDHYLHVSGQVIEWDPKGDWTNPVEVVLTVAHVDQNPQNNHPDNLRAWCQRCHLNHDRPFNIEKTRRKRAIASGQLAIKL